MRIIQFSLVAIAAMVSGCTVGTNARVTEDPPIWGRTDCQRGAGNPELQTEFDNAKTTCLARGETAAAVAGIEGNNLCMNEQGYVLKTRAEHAVACQGGPEQKSKTAVSKATPELKNGAPANRSERARAKQ